MDFAKSITAVYSDTSDWVFPSGISGKQNAVKLRASDGTNHSPALASTYNDVAGAISTGQTELAVMILRHNPRLAAEKNKWGCTLLHWYGCSLMRSNGLKLETCDLLLRRRAAYYGSSPCVVCALLGANPGAAATPTMTDRYAA
eukprot:SAG31_NODE_70_length_28117_cov_100.521843_23_plen_144_part_00